MSIDLKRNVETIRMREEMEARIVENCYRKMSKRVIRKV